jgi:hypothetical protein
MQGGDAGPAMQVVGSRGWTFGLPKCPAFLSSRARGPVEPVKVACRNMIKQLNPCPGRIVHS